MADRCAGRVSSGAWLSGVPELGGDDRSSCERGASGTATSTASSAGLRASSINIKTVMIKKTSTSSRNWTRLDE